MTFTNKFKDLKKFYTIFIIIILFLNTALISNLHANSFKISEIEVSQDFNLDFNKKKVFDEAFKAAYVQLISTIITSKDKKKIEKINLSTIKSLIDSFNVSDEKFLEDRYYATINVNFNKKNTYNYFASQNIFPSIPRKLNLLVLPILINRNQDEIIYFGENPIYKNWNNFNEKYHLLNYILPTEDIEDRQIFKNKIELIEEYKFDEIIKKYDLENYIILIIYQNENEINLLSKLQLKNTYKIFNITYTDIDLYEEQSFSKLIINLKTLYEDEWKELNLINTSIKLPLTISLSSKDHNKIKSFEKILEHLDLVSNYEVLSFNNNELTRLPESLGDLSNLEGLADGHYTIGIRPHSITPYKQTENSVQIKGKVLIAELSGSESIIHFQSGDIKWVSLSTGIHPLKVGAEAELHMDVNQFLYFDQNNKLINHV